jgi:putative spermidine/putrescine transport system ATP-binding protein
VQRIGMVFQNFNLFPHRTILDNVTLAPRYHGRDKAISEQRAYALLDKVGLLAHAQKYPHQLSGGQQQRVALARALIFEPPLLLLDEPLSALDRRLRQEMQVELARMHKEFGTTFVFVTHDQEEALALSDRVAVFNHGRLEQLGTPQEVYERPASRFVANFLGDTNLLSVRDISRRDDALVCSYQSRPLWVTQGVQQPLPAASSESWLAIRPEHVDLQPLAQVGNGNGVVAQVEHLTYLGTHVNVDLRTPDAQQIALRIAVSHPLLNGLERGQPYWCTWSRQHGHLLST